jgi:hypothetical protein
VEDEGHPVLAAGKVENELGGREQPHVKIIQLLSLSMMLMQNKLECLSFNNLFGCNLFAIVVSGKEKKYFITLTTDVKIIE